MVRVRVPITTEIEFDVPDPIPGPPGQPGLMGPMGPAGPQGPPGTGGGEPLPPQPPTIFDEIRSAFDHRASKAAGRALPLVASWNMGDFERDGRFVGFGADFQRVRIEAGCQNVLPYVQAPWPGQTDNPRYFADAHMGAFLRWLREHELPLTLGSTQWEGAFAVGVEWKDLPFEQNPCAFDLAGVRKDWVDVMGPIAPWREVGRRWGSSPVLRQMRDWHGGERVVVLSNNEARRVQWHELPTSKRYMDAFASIESAPSVPSTPEAPNAKRVHRNVVAAQGFGFRVDQMHRAYRAASGLDPIFVGYNAFGPPHFARWGGWTEYAVYFEGCLNAPSFGWDGGSPSYYENDWDAQLDHTVWSPQVEAQNYVAMMREVRPSFWFELSCWDGGAANRTKYLAMGQTPSPERYEGMIGFGAWLLRPRVLRDFRGWTETVAVEGPYFDAVARVVDRVHADSTLRRFWKHGELVPNAAHPHPYQEWIPPEYASEPRWFQLDTSADPPRPWNLRTKLRAFALALQLGNEWLVYAHAPQGDEANVDVQVPGLGSVRLDVPLAGTLKVVVGQP